MAGWQPKIIVQSVGAKGERVHYLSLLSRQLLSTELISWSVMSVGVIDRSINSRNTCYCPSGNQSHLGHFDFCEERHGDGANCCVFIAEKDGESE